MTKRVLISFVVIILSMIVATNFINRRNIYGDDSESIVKVIESLDMYESSEIVLLDVRDFGDHRIAAFLSDGHPSYILFEDEGSGRYKYQVTETRGAEEFHSFAIPIYSLEQADIIVLSVKNDMSEVAEMRIKVNGEVHAVLFNEKGADVRWTEIEKSTDGNYAIEQYEIYNEY